MFTVYVGAFHDESRVWKAFAGRSGESGAVGNRQQLPSGRNQQVGPVEKCGEVERPASGKMKKIKNIKKYRKKHFSKKEDCCQNKKSKKEEKIKTNVSKQK